MVAAFMILLLSVAMYSIRIKIVSKDENGVSPVNGFKRLGVVRQRGYQCVSPVRNVAFRGPARSTPRLPAQRATSSTGSDCFQVTRPGLSVGGTQDSKHHRCAVGCHGLLLVRVQGISTGQSVRRLTGGAIVLFGVGYSTTATGNQQYCCKNRKAHDSQHGRTAATSQRQFKATGVVLVCNFKTITYGITRNRDFQWFCQQLVTI